MPIFFDPSKVLKLLSHTPYWMRFGIYLSVGGIFVFLSCFIVFVSNLDTKPAHYPKADAIVVLTGTATKRISTGLNVLSSGKGKRLLISGVHPNQNFDTILNMGDKSIRAYTCCIDLDYEATNTIGNAHQTAKWMRTYNYRSLIVITSAHHMPRGFLELRRAMPNIRFSLHPIVPEHVHLDRWWSYPGTLTLLMGEYVRFVWSLANLPRSFAKNSKSLSTQK